MPQDQLSREALAHTQLRRLEPFGSVGLRGAGPFGRSERERSWVQMSSGDGGGTGGVTKGAIGLGALSQLAMAASACGCVYDQACVRNASVPTVSSPCSTSCLPGGVGSTETTTVAEHGPNSGTLVSARIAVHATAAANVSPRAIFMELKGEKAKQSDDQLAFQRRCILADADYVIARGIEDVQNAGL